jgi:hypothetical protein
MTAIRRGCAGQEAVVFEQHHSGRSDLAGQGVVADIEASPFGGGGGPLDEGEDPLHRLVQHRLVQLACLDGLDHRLGASGFGAGHFQVQPGLQRPDTVVYSIAQSETTSPAKPHSFRSSVVSRAVSSAP